MKFDDLKTKLGIKNGALSSNQVSISMQDMTDTIDDLIKYCYDSQPIQINNPKLEKTDDKVQSVTISGKASFLNVPDMPVNATWTVDKDGNVQAMLKYEVLNDAPGPNDWTFKKSFPDLPEVQDFNFPTYRYYKRNFKRDEEELMKHVPQRQHPISLSDRHTRVLRWTRW